MTEPYRDRVCTVCAEPVERHTESYCNGCGALFHLNQREDLSGRDCGIVSISNEHLALEFVCFSCLESNVETQLNEVLDLSEGASIAGISEDELINAAEAGQIRHRRTASGTYLFERHALEEIIRGSG